MVTKRHFWPIPKTVAMGLTRTIPGGIAVSIANDHIRGMRPSIGADSKRIQAISRRLSLVGLEQMFSETSFWGAAQFSLRTFNEPVCTAPEMPRLYSRMCHPFPSCCYLSWYRPRKRRAVWTEQRTPSHNLAAKWENGVVCS
jgi:hypothetical protein